MKTSEKPTWLKKNRPLAPQAATRSLANRIWSLIESEQPATLRPWRPSLALSLSLVLASLATWIVLSSPELQQPEAWEEDIQWAFSPADADVMEWDPAGDFLDIVL